MENDGFYVLGDENYDSDDTANFFEMYPDEIKLRDTWDLMKSACSSIFLDERTCPGNCTCLSDRFNSGFDLFTNLINFTTSLNIMSKWGYHSLSQILGNFPL